MNIAATHGDLVEMRPRFNDRLALWLVKLAKLRRLSFRQPTGEDYKQFYENFFEEKDVEAYELDRRMTIRRQTIDQFLKAYAPTPAKLLDVGCGLGDVLAGLPSGYEQYGIDYAASNVKVATRRLGGQAQIQHAGIYEMPYESNSMDVCLCLEVLEHIEDDAQAVREISRVLKPGGILIAAVPYTYYWPEYLKLMGHFRHYTRESFSALMNKNGLTTEAYLPNYPTWHQAYTRRYAMIRAQSILFGRAVGHRALYRFKWPWQRQTALERLAGELDSLRERDNQLDYAQQPSSTFLMARKSSAYAH